MRCNSSSHIITVTDFFWRWTFASAATSRRTEQTKFEIESIGALSKRRKREHNSTDRWWPGD
jgi:hypothetical protein